MAVRMSNVAVLRSILSWLLDHVTSAISSPNSMLSDHHRRLVSSSEYELSLSYCEHGPSLDGIPSSCTGSLFFFLFDAMDLFSLGGLCSHYRPHDILWRGVLLPSKNIHSYSHDYLTIRKQELQRVLKWGNKPPKLKRSTYWEKNLTK